MSTDMSRSRLKSITSFSKMGTPYREQSPPKIASHPGKSTFWWVKTSGS